MRRRAKWEFFLFEKQSVKREQRQNWRKYISQKVNCIAQQLGDVENTGQKKKYFHLHQMPQTIPHLPYKFPKTPPENFSKFSAAVQTKAEFNCSK